MKLIPDAVGRSLIGLAVRGQKHSPTILFGVGVTSMVGSTVLACRATLKLEEVLDEIERNKDQAQQVSELVNSDSYKGDQTYTENEKQRDLYIIRVRGVVSVVKLYAPAVVLGGVGIACLTKSQAILKQRNAALTAAYVALDTAFGKYRERLIQRHGEDEDRILRYGAEEVDVIDDETGKVVTTMRADPGELPSGYARWFDAESSLEYTPPPHTEYNWVFLRNQQNWVNDMLRSRGHLFLNEVYAMVGLDHTSAGAIVGWVYDRDNERGDNYVDFGCWDPDTGRGLDFFEGGNGREHGILLDFNVDGPIWDLLDKRNDRHE